jgi:tight adherence protein B
MIFLGITIIWIVSLWYFQDIFIHAMARIHGQDTKRLSKLKYRLHENFIFQERSKLQKISRWFLLIGVILSLIFFSPTLLVLIFILYLIFPIVWIRYIEFSRRKKFQKQLLQLIPLLSSMLRTGHSLERSFFEIKKTIGPPMSEEIQYMLNEMKLGSTLEKSLDKLVQRFLSENLLTLSQAITISRKLGTSLTEAMDHISQNILQKEKLKQQIHSLTSQGRMQAYIAVSMPFFIGLALQLISPKYFIPLFTTPIGLASMAYGGVSMFIGLIWIHRIVTKEYL